MQLYVKSAKKLDVSAFSQKINEVNAIPAHKRTMNVIQGNVHLYSGEFEKAFLCYVKAGFTRNLVRLARAALAKGCTSIAKLSFELSGAQPSKNENEIIKGDLCLNDEDLMGAKMHYKNANARQRLIGLGLHALKNDFVLIALDCYKNAREKPPKDDLENFINGYIADIDQRIKQRRHIGVKEACFALGEKARLKSIGKLLIDKGEILLGICLFEDSGETFPASTLLDSQKSKLIAEGDSDCRRGIRINHCFYGTGIKAYAIAGERNRLMSLYNECLENKELGYAVIILKALYGEPVKNNIPDNVAEKMLLYSKIQFQNGNFREGMKACDIVGKKAQKVDLYACGEKCFFRSDEKEIIMQSPEFFLKGLKSYKKAGLSPSNSKIIAAGYRFLELHFYYYARQAFEEARSIEHLENLIKFFEKKNSELTKEKENRQKSEDWKLKIQNASASDEVKKHLVQLRDESFDSRIRFNENEICEIKQAIRRIDVNNK